MRFFNNLFAADIKMPHPDSTIPGVDSINVQESFSASIVNGNFVVDGDLSDWGNQLKWIAIDRAFGTTPDDITEARMAIRWDASSNKIYVAVEVDDAVHTFTSSYVTGQIRLQKANGFGR